MIILLHQVWHSSTRMKFSRSPLIMIIVFHVSANDCATIFTCTLTVQYSVLLQLHTSEHIALISCASLILVVGLKACRKVHLRLHVGKQQMMLAVSWMHVSCLFELYRVLTCMHESVHDASTYTGGCSCMHVYYFTHTETVMQTACIRHACR